MYLLNKSPYGKSRFRLSVRVLVVCCRECIRVLLVLFNYFSYSDKASLYALIFSV